MDLEYRTYDQTQIECRVRDKTQGIIDVRSNVCDQMDSYDSVFAPGIWDRAVADQAFLPYVFLDHEPDKQIGRLTATSERRDASGIWQHSTARLNLEKQLARETLSDIEERFREFYSHGFKSDPAAEKYERRDGRTARIINRLKFWPDLSSVLVPGGSGTATLAVRSAALMARPAASDEHVCQVAPIDGCTEVRSAVEHEEDRPYVTDYGHRAGLGWTLTTIHYPAAQWTAAEARAHALAHAGGEFNPATGERGDAQRFALADLSAPALAVLPDLARVLVEYRAVAEKDDAPKSPPKGYPTEMSKYGDPTNYKYPLDTDARIHAAVAYFNHDGQQSAGGYSDTEWASIGRKIAAAADIAFGSGYKFESGKVTTPETSNAPSQRSAAGTSETTASDALATETRLRLASARLADMGLSLRHSALSKANTGTLRQAHDAMAAAVPGFCPVNDGSGEPDADDTGSGAGY